MTSVFSELWEQCEEKGPLPLIAYACDTFGTKLKQPDMVRAIAWADANAKGDEPWSELALHLGNAWRMMIATTDPKGFAPHKAKIPEADRWQDHYLAVFQDESLSLPLRVALGGPVINVKIDHTKPELVHAGAIVMADALLADAPFNGWRYVNFINAFNQIPKDDAMGGNGPSHARWLGSQKPEQQAGSQYRTAMGSVDDSGSDDAGDARKTGRHRKAEQISQRRKCSQSNQGMRPNHLLSGTLRLFR